MDLTKLTRRHGIKIASAFPCSVEECSLAVGGLVGHSSVKSAARMNNAVVIFLDSVEKVNMVVATGIQVNDTFVSVLPLATPAVKVTLSNVPPFIRDETLIRELSRHGKIMSNLNKVSSGCRSPLLRHVVSHRRHLYMILNNRTEDLNLVFKIRVEDFDYMIFVTSNNSKCFSCGKEGHQAKACPQKNKTAGAQEQQEETEGAQQQGQEGQEGTSETQHERQVSEEGQGVTEEIPKEGRVSEKGTEEVPKEGQVSEGGQEGTEEVPKGGTVNKEGQEGTAGVQQTGQVSEEGQEGTRGVQKAGQVSQEGQEGTEITKQVDKVIKEGQEGTEGVQKTDQEGVREQESEVDMEGEEETLKVPHLKRKTRSSNGSSKAKKGAGKKGGRGAAGSESNMETDSADSESSDFRAGSQRNVRSYSVGKIKGFLQKTKNMKGLKIEDYFSDKEQLSNSARLHMSSKGRGGFSDQEIYRLKKIVQRVRQEINNDEDEF